MSQPRYGDLPVNRSRVTLLPWQRNPTHEPVEQEFVIVISRGEPRRSDELMHDAVLELVRAWQARFNPDDPAGIADLVAATIATQHIYPLGSQGVRVYRALLEVYLTQARKAAA